MVWSLDFAAVWDCVLDNIWERYVSLRKKGPWEPPKDKYNHEPSPSLSRGEVDSSVFGITVTVMVVILKKIIL